MCLRPWSTRPECPEEGVCQVLQSNHHGKCDGNHIPFERSSGLLFLIHQEELLSPWAENELGGSKSKTVPCKGLSPGLSRELATCFFFGKQREHRVWTYCKCWKAAQLNLGKINRVNKENMPVATIGVGGSHGTNGADLAVALWECPGFSISPKGSWAQGKCCKLWSDCILFMKRCQMVWETRCGPHVWLQLLRSHSAHYMEWFMGVSLNIADCPVTVLPLVTHDKTCDAGLLHHSKGMHSSARIKQEWVGQHY